jgi:N-glycosylase/DNA lyase
MSAVTNEGTYKGIQSLFNDMASEAEVPPILLDYMLWDMQHVRVE